MSIVDPNEEIDKLKNFDSIPLLCVRCGFHTTIAQPGEQVLDALYEASNLQELKHELAMLQRTQALFERFPLSRHPQKLSKEFLAKDSPPSAPDPELDAALNCDPELKKFLYSSSFRLVGRMEAVKEMIAREERPDLPLLRCTNCIEGHLCIEPQFVQRVMWMR